MYRHYERRKKRHSVASLLTPVVWGGIRGPPKQECPRKTKKDKGEAYDHCS